MTPDAATEPAVPREPGLLSLRLSVMFFLQFAAMAMWVPLLGTCLSAAVEKGGLGFSELELGLIMGVPATLAALLAPFVAGQLADRYFSTERLISVCAIASGALLWLAASQRAFSTWLALLVASAVLRAPVYTLSNTLCFAHLTDSKTRFPRIRSWGTIGWIVGSWMFALVWLKRTRAGTVADRPKPISRNTRFNFPRFPPFLPFPSCPLFPPLILLAPCFHGIVDQDALRHNLSTTASRRIPWP